MRRDPKELAEQQAAIEAHQQREFGPEVTAVTREQLTKHQARSFMTDPRYTELREHLRAVAYPRHFAKGPISAPSGTLSEHGLVRWGAQAFWDYIEAIAQPEEVQP